MRGERQDFFDWTDLCRAIAATLVAFSHARDVLMIDYPGQRPWLPFYALTGFGHSGVIVFFVLSGFWISRSVLRRIDDQRFWPAYLIDRLSRLGIVLVPALVLGGLLDVAGTGWWHLPVYQGLTGAHSLTRNVAATLTLPVLLGNLAFLQTIAVAPWGSNGPLWSLAFEFWFYIWFPALALLIHRRRLSPALLALLIGFANPGLYWGFASWLVGWVLLLRIEAKPVGKPVARAWAGFAACLFAALLLASGAIRQSWLDLPLAIGFGLLLLALVVTALPFPRMLTPVAHYGRRASFSLYAIHFPIVALIGGSITGPARLAPSGLAVALVLALTALCLVAAWLFAQCSEAFTPRLRDWLRQRFPASLPPISAV
jgi:peptidoglycan/LPS O-acetylase OafA/YrhL